MQEIQIQNMTTQPPVGQNEERLAAHASSQQVKIPEGF